MLLILALSRDTQLSEFKVSQHLVATWNVDNNIELASSEATNPDMALCDNMDSNLTFLIRCFE